MRKGKSLALTQTRGRDVRQYDLFDLEGLSLVKVDFIRYCLQVAHFRRWELSDDTLTEELLAVLSKIPKEQTVNGKTVNGKTVNGKN